MLRNRYHHESKRIRISQLKNRSTEKQECDNWWTNEHGISLNKKATSNRGKNKTYCMKPSSGFHVLVKSDLACVISRVLFILEKFRYVDSTIDTWLFKKIYALFFFLPRSECILLISYYFFLLFLFKRFSFEVAVCSGSLSSLVHFL